MSVTRRVQGTGQGRRWRQAMLVGAVLVVSGCAVPDSLNPLDWFGDDTAAPEDAVAADVRERAEATAEAAEDAPFPALSSVPERPTGLAAPSVRQRVVEGLIADRENARYTDDAPRVAGERRPEPLGSDSVAVSPAGGPGDTRTAAVDVAPPPVPPRPGAADGGSSAANNQVAARSLPAPPAPTPAAGLGEPLATIQFAVNSTNLDQRDIDILRQVADISAQSGAAVRVIGHASGGANTPAAQQANQDVSVARARAVANALIALGVPRQRLTFEGRSDLVPLFDEGTAAGAAGNRRAEVYLVL